MSQQWLRFSRGVDVGKRADGARSEFIALYFHKPPGRTVDDSDSCSSHRVANHVLRVACIEYRISYFFNGPPATGCGRRAVTACS